MYISNMQHFLDETGNIPKQMPKEARELASFLALVIDTTTKNLPPTLTTTDVKCFKKGCSGMIKSAFRPDTEEIHWYCPDCEVDGLINGWQGTKWDNR
jgi:hypothetical protein